MIKKILWILLIALVAIQFIHPAKNLGSGSTANDISRHYPVPNSVEVLLKTACYNCHSDSSSYPWYNHIQPVAWFLADHINEGKRHLNFSEFGTYDSLRAAKQFRSIKFNVMHREMPLSSYLWMHPEARLSDVQFKAIETWAAGLQQKMGLSDTAFRHRD